jgi:hypothetical protein
MTTGGSMGNEVACTLRQNGQSFVGKALLESSEIVFRGETRLKIALSAITSILAKDGQLHIRSRGCLAVFHLGPQAEKWREKIANPKSVLEKLGIKHGQSVSVIGSFPADFLASLQKEGARVAKAKIAKDSQWIFLAAEGKQDLRRVPIFRKAIRGATTLWLVYPKGQESITEADVRSAGLKAGLVDVKVVRFSATHTALKFVLPRSSR